MSVNSSWYRPSMPEQLTALQKLTYGLDVIVRDIGYIPVVGAVVGIPRVITGIFQYTFAKENGSLEFSEEDCTIRFRGSKVAADGLANIGRGIFETIPVIGSISLILLDASAEDRWFLLPGIKAPSSE